MKIARRFNAVVGLAITRVPKGRLMEGTSCVNCGIDSAVPSGLESSVFNPPGVETPGYYRRSLGDRDCLSSTPGVKRRAIIADPFGTMMANFRARQNFCLYVLNTAKM